MALGYNSISNMGFVRQTVSNEVIQYIEDRFSGKRKTSLQEDLGYENLALSPEILARLNPIQRNIILFAEPLIKEVNDFYSTYVQ